MNAARPEGLALVSVDHIHPCPFQPRVNVSMDLVRKLAESMRAGRHEPLLEVEPAPLQPGHYQIVCGEQRWRAAREAGLKRILVRIHPRLAYLERLRKQYEENRLRSDLDPVEDARAVRVTWNVVAAIGMDRGSGEGWTTVNKVEASSRSIPAASDREALTGPPRRRQRGHLSPSPSPGVKRLTSLHDRGRIH